MALILWLQEAAVEEKRQQERSHVDCVSLLYIPVAQPEKTKMRKVYFSSQFQLTAAGSLWKHSKVRQEHGVQDAACLMVVGSKQRKSGDGPRLPCKGTAQ